MAGAVLKFLGIPHDPQVNLPSECKSLSSAGSTSHSSTSSSRQRPCPCSASPPCLFDSKLQEFTRSPSLRLQEQLHSQFSKLKRKSKMLLFQKREPNNDLYRSNSFMFQKSRRNRRRTRMARRVEMREDYSRPMDFVARGDPIACRRTFQLIRDSFPGLHGELLVLDNYSDPADVKSYIEPGDETLEKVYTLQEEAFPDDDKDYMQPIEDPAKDSEGEECGCGAGIRFDANHSVRIAVPGSRSRSLPHVYENVTWIRIATPDEDPSEGLSLSLSLTDPSTSFEPSEDEFYPNGLQCCLQCCRCGEEAMRKSLLVGLPSRVKSRGLFPLLKRPAKGKSSPGSISGSASADSSLDSAASSREEKELVEGISALTCERDPAPPEREVPLEREVPSDGEVPFEMPKLRRGRGRPRPKSDVFPTPVYISSVEGASTPNGTESPGVAPVKPPRKCLHLDLSSSPSQCDLSQSAINVEIPLQRQRWYHGAISRRDAENLLRVMKEGSFLVRNSESSRLGYSLSLKSARGFMHMRIRDERDTGGYILGEFSKPFPSIPHMVQHYSLNRLPIKGAEHMSLLYPVEEQLL